MEEKKKKGEKKKKIEKKTQKKEKRKKGKRRKRISLKLFEQTKFVRRTVDSIISLAPLRREERKKKRN